MQARIKQLLARMDELSLRERVILFVGILVTLFVVWDVVLMGPVTLHEKSAQQRIDHLHSQIATLNKPIDRSPLLGRGAGVSPRPSCCAAHS